MDPNRNLEEQRRLSNLILNGDPITGEDVLQLAELVQAMDAWLHAGGFLPAEWRERRRAAPRF